MTKSEIRTSVERLVNLIDANGTNAEVEKLLVRSLDEIALAYHYSDYGFDEHEYGELPKRDYDNLRKRVTDRFPELGFYNIPLKINDALPDSEISLGDPIDDITDLALDMIEILWRWKNTSETDALWYFRFGYSSHWGNHLRSLQLYLFSRIYE